MKDYLIVYCVVEKGLATVTFHTVKSRNRRSISAPLTKNKNKTKTYKLAYSLITKIDSVRRNRVHFVWVSLNKMQI